MLVLFFIMYILFLILGIFSVISLYAKFCEINHLLFRVRELFNFAYGIIWFVYMPILNVFISLVILVVILNYKNSEL